MQLQLQKSKTLIHNNFELKSDWWDRETKIFSVLKYCCMINLNNFLAAKRSSTRALVLCPSVRLSVRLQNWISHCLVSLWQLLTFYDNLWQLMTTDDNLWQLMTTYDNLWQLMTTYDNLWQLMTVNLTP